MDEGADIIVGTRYYTNKLKLLMRVTKSFIVEVASMFLIILFIYAATSKLLEFEKFRIDIGKSPLLYRFTSVIPELVIISEFVISIGLMIKRYQFLALYGSTALMVMFSTYIILIMRFSPFTPCSCGGVLENMSWGQHLVFNLAFVILGQCAIFYYPTTDQKSYSR